MVGWVRNAVAWEEASVRVLLPDAAGRLRTFAARGDPVNGGRLRSARRRQVFQTGHPMIVTLRTRPATRWPSIRSWREGARSA